MTCKKSKLLCGAGFILIGAIGTILILASQKPDEFYVTRSAVIEARPAVVFEKVNNLQNWNSFSPWAKLDPDAKVAFEGPKAGKGAAFKWDGDGNVGAGTMTITESKRNELVKFKLDFKRPFEDTSTVDFTFHPDSKGTFVTWSMHGENNFFAKIISVVMDCDKMMGKFFEEGLANLNRVSKAQ
jgi:hypothetical protein